MSKRGKKYEAVRAKAETRDYEVAEAVAFLKDNPAAKFDETAELAFSLGVDPRNADQAVRGTVALPHGTGRTVRVLVFAGGDAADAAREAGAEFVGMDDMIEKVTSGWSDFEVAVATPDAMKEVRKLGKFLGPRGLMPNPKVGTVTNDVAAAVEQCKAGRVEFRMDRQGNVHVPFGKLSFPQDQLVANAETVISAIQGAKPAAAKGQYVKRCTVSSTMGVGLHVAIRDTEAGTTG